MYTEDSGGATGAICLLEEAASGAVNVYPPSSLLNSIGRSEAITQMEYRATSPL